MLELDKLGLEWKALRDVEQHDIPKQAGVYFFRTGDGRLLGYPEGSSRVFYIGKSINLRKRLYTHAKFHNEAGSKDTRTLDVYYTRYEYSSRFDGEYCFIVGDQPKLMEEAALERFALRHFSFPLANAVGSWKSINKRERAEELALPF